MSGAWDEIASAIAAGSERAVARACRYVDERVPGCGDLLDALPQGHAWLVGITGAPGVGKSTLTQALVTALRQGGKRVGVIAVDPTSPYSGGAILGDRIRMQQHFLDPDVFIRSVATRGALGGLSLSVWDVARVVSAWGADVILLETVGVGQDEVEVTAGAGSTIVVVAPGLGDDMQAAKAGLLECADIFAVNKADRPGADAVVQQLETMLALGDAARAVGPGESSHAPGHHGARVAAAASAEPSVWRPAVLSTVATSGVGIPQLLDAVEAHHAWLTSSAGETARLRQATQRLASLLRAEVGRALDGPLRTRVQGVAQAVADGICDERSAVSGLLEDLAAALPRSG